VRTHEAEAAEQEALARQARAESDRKAAAADRLQMQADERGELASAKRDEQRDRLRAADDLDPDVPEGERNDDRGDADGHRHRGPGREARDDRGASAEHRAGRKPSPRLIVSTAIVSPAAAGLTSDPASCSTVGAWPTWCA